MSKTEFTLFCYAPLPAKAARVIRQLQRNAGYAHPLSTPHISIYICGFSKKAFAELCGQIDKLELSKLNTKGGMLKYFASKNGGTFYFLRFPGKSLSKLHEKILDVANPLRDGFQRSKELKRIKQGIYTKTEQKYLEKYGYVKVKDKFDPHVTIADQLIMSSEKIIKLNKIIKESLDSVELKNIVASLYEIKRDKMKLVKRKVFALK